MKFPSSITVCEVGLRDGLQNEQTLIPTEEKAALLRDIIDAGFPVIEVGSFMSPKAVPQMADTDELFKGLSNQGAEFRALIANAKGVERAAACGCKKVKLNVSASVSHNLANLNKTPAESVAGFAECVEVAHANNVGVSGSISMPFGSPWDREIPVSDIKDIVDSYLAVGIDEISLSDTSGMAYPTQVYDICTLMQKDYPGVTWWLHFHNTRGMALANIIMAMGAGITRFDSAFAGVGGCPFVPGAAGNVASEDLLHMCDEMGIATGVSLDKSIAIGKRLQELIGRSTDSYIQRAGKSKSLVRELPKGQTKFPKK